MRRAEPFSTEERERVESALRAGGEPTCPRCATSLDERPVPARRDVSYVRDRIWLVCPRCHRSVVLDRRDLG